MKHSNDANGPRLAAEFVKEARFKSGISRAELARRIGTSKATICRLENSSGKLGPSIGTLARIASACDLQISLVVS